MLTFRWTVGHIGIKGNEEVDGEAKKVAEGLSSSKRELPTLLRKPVKHNKAALRQQRKDLLKARWKKEWEASIRANKYKALDLIAPSDKFIKLISNNKLSRNDASRIFQLRTGHVPLNAYLERFKRVDSAGCPACGHPKEDTQHYLFDCPAYGHECWTLLQHCKTREPKMKDVLSSTDLAVPLANFIQALGRFKQGETQRHRRESRLRQDFGPQPHTPRHEGPPI